MKKNTALSPVRRRQRLIVGALCVALLIVLFGVWNVWRKNRAINQEIASLQNEITDLRQNNIEMRQLVDYFNSTAYIEDKARTDLGLKKDGENVVVVPDNAKDLLLATRTGADAQAAEKVVSNPQKWWSYFFN